VIPLKQPAPSPNKLASVPWLPWAIAACLAMVAMVQVVQNGSLEHQLARNTKALQAKVDTLSAQVAELQKTDFLSQFRIALLNTAVENSKASAVSVWDNERQKGVMMVENLPVLPADKDYQLWIIHSKYPTPVNGGVFTVDQNGRVRFYFKPDMPMPGVDKFAVTVEKKGGVPKSEGKIVLVGG
jgi:anti-sigma-K factor RskA